MMSDYDIKRFAPGRKVVSRKGSTIWRIDSADAQFETLYVSDDNGFSCKLLTHNFDIHYYLEPDLPAGIDPDWISELFPEKPSCDCGGLKTYNSLEPLYHSHWCSIMAKRS